MEKQQLTELQRLVAKGTYEIGEFSFLVVWGERDLGYWYFSAECSLDTHGMVKLYADSVYNTVFMVETEQVQIKWDGASLTLYISEE